MLEIHSQCRSRNAKSRLWRLLSSLPRVLDNTERFERGHGFTRLDNDLTLAERRKETWPRMDAWPWMRLRNLCFGDSYLIFAHRALLVAFCSYIV